jgi:peroxiredoxin Q/BCP
MLEFCINRNATLVNRALILYNKINNIQIIQEIAMPIASGIQAPDFALPDENNTTRRLSDFRGRTVVLYFYPKDDTPGCTTEACNFRDDYSAYVNADVVILGISPDDTKSHAKFKQKFTLQFLLLADDEHEVCNQYGVWGPKKFMGRQYEGVLRTTFLVDGNGRIAKVFENVKPAEHSAEVLAAIKSL